MPDTFARRRVSTLCKSLRAASTSLTSEHLSVNDDLTLGGRIVRAGSEDARGYSASESVSVVLSMAKGMSRRVVASAYQIDELYNLSSKTSDASEETRN